MKWQNSRLFQPCPFCGHKPRQDSSIVVEPTEYPTDKVVQHAALLDASRTKVYVRCSRCLARGPVLLLDAFILRAAKESWGRRQRKARAR